MPVYYDASLISPAPFVSINKDYVRGSDGKKIGATYSITLEGTFLAHKGSPNKTGTFTSIPGLGQSYEEPANQAVEQDELQYSLFNKSSALRKVFSRDGRRLDLLTWKKDGDGKYTIGYYCFPRVISVSIDDNRYIEPMPYTVTLEVDEIFHTSDLSNTLGLEDFKNANLNITTEETENFTEKFLFKGNNRIYLSDASESWSISEADSNAPITNFGTSSSILNDGVASKQSPIYEVTHTISAVGKRAYGPVQEGSVSPGGLIRDAWENAKIWVQHRVGVGERVGGDPKDYVSYEEIFGNPEGKIKGYKKDRKNSTTFQGNDWGGLLSREGSDNALTNYKPVNVIRSQDVDISSGSYSITESFLLIDTGQFYEPDVSSGPFKVTEEVNVDESYDYSGNVSTVTVNCTITGYDERGGSNNQASQYDIISVSKYTNALSRYDAVWSGDTGEENAFLLAKSYGEDVSSLHSHPVSKTIAKNEKSGTITVVFVFNTRSNNLGLTEAPLSETISIVYNNPVPKVAVIEVPGRSSGPVLQPMGTQSIASVSVTIDITLPRGSSDYGAMTSAVTAAIKQYQPSGGVVYRTADNENYDIWSKKYSRTVTWNYQDC